MQVGRTVTLLCGAAAVAHSFPALAEDDRSSAIIVTGSRTGSSVGTVTRQTAEFIPAIPVSHLFECLAE